MANIIENKQGINPPKFGLIESSILTCGSVFEVAIRRNKLLIDKSLFIKDFLENADDCVAILRPRRFGKSLNLSMLSYFLDQQVKDQATIFQQFAIMKEKEIVEKHMGKYPVVFLSLKDCISGTWVNMREKIWLALCEICDPYL